MKNIYLATCFCLIAHVGGSSIATIMVLEESPDPVICYNCTMFCLMNFYLLLITMITCIRLMSVLGSNTNILLLLLLHPMISA